MKYRTAVYSTVSTVNSYEDFTVLNALILCHFYKLMPESIYTTHYNFYSKENSAKQVTDSIITPLSEKEIGQARKTKIYIHTHFFSRHSIRFKRHSIRSLN